MILTVSDVEFLFKTHPIASHVGITKTVVDKLIAFEEVNHFAQPIKEKQKAFIHKLDACIKRISDSEFSSVNRYRLFEDSVVLFVMYNPSDETIEKSTILPVVTKPLQRSTLMVDIGDYQLDIPRYTQHTEELFKRPAGPNRLYFIPVASPIMDRTVVVKREIEKLGINSPEFDLFTGESIINFEHRKTAQYLKLFTRRLRNRVCLTKEWNAMLVDFPYIEQPMSEKDVETFIATNEFSRTEQLFLRLHSTGVV